VVIDTAGNRILFRGTRREFAQMLRLLRELDVAPKQVLVEITIAEVSLTDETRFGMEWFLDRQITGGSIQATTGGGLAREVAGLGITYARSFDQTSVTAALSAIATNQNLNIISTPKLMARSGGQAQILVGNDVPIITSQRATDVQSAGDTDVLQTVQYRQTGVILNIRPVVLDDDHIDLEIFQEVSSQQPNLTSAISSPVISNRSVTTRLSLRAGMTAVLGGMIQDSQTMGQRGVPLLKDIPLIGRAFRTDSASKHKTELLVLVTPRVIREDKTMQDLAANFGSAMNGLMQGRGQRTFTLVPWMPGAAMPPHSHYRPIRQTRTKEPWP
jgi:general secretion pathway protein D